MCPRRGTPADHAGSSDAPPVSLADTANTPVATAPPVSMRNGTTEQGRPKVKARRCKKAAGAADGEGAVVLAPAAVEKGPGTMNPCPYNVLDCIKGSDSALGISVAEIERALSGRNYTTGQIRSVPLLLGRV